MNYWALLSRCLALVYLVNYTAANTEKVIFRSPKTPFYLSQDLPVIGPVDSRVGTLVYELNMTQGRHAMQWFSVENMGFNWHYELRLCWPAIMPTEFEINIFSVEDYITIHDLDASRTQVKDNSTQMMLLISATPDFVTHLPDMSDTTVKFELVLDPLVLESCLGAFSVRFS
ncbi:hypothetical protein MRB53_039781 [Persea americana]|nr:hypothetical protein MRB53_039781 [Persea americana]